MNEGGQALIGNVRKDGGGKDRSPTLELDSSSQQVAHAPHPAPNAERELVPGAGDAERPMSDARRTVSGGAPKGNKNAFKHGLIAAATSSAYAGWSLVLPWPNIG